MTRLLLCARPATGGSARVIEALLRRLPERGFTGTAALSGTEGDALLTAAGEHGWRARRVDMERAVRPWPDLKAGLALRRLVHGHDLVHAHAAKAGALARLACRGGPPLVYSPHGFYFTYHAEDSKPYRRYLGLERKLAPLTTMLHCVSEAEQSVALRHGLVDADRARVVPNPVPPRSAPRDPDEVLRGLGVDAGEVVVLMAARLTAPKDPVTFVRAADDAPTGLRFVLAGDGPLLAAAREAGAGRAVFAGEQDDVRGLLTRARVAVLTSASEALPVFLVEAMAGGVPVVATDLPGCREACADGALYVRPDDPGSIAAAVARIASDDKLHARLSANARAHAARYDEERWLDAMVALYTDALGA